MDFFFHFFICRKNFYVWSRLAWKGRKISNYSYLALFLGYSKYFVGIKSTLFLNYKDAMHFCHAYAPIFIWNRVEGLCSKPLEGFQYLLSVHRNCSRGQPCLFIPEMTKSLPNFFLQLLLRTSSNAKRLQTWIKY